MSPKTIFPAPKLTPHSGDKNRITTPINWIPGDDVIVHPSVTNDEAKTLFPQFRIVKPYLRFTPLPKEKTSANI